jgi:hypothetical protein
MIRMTAVVIVSLGFIAPASAQSLADAAAASKKARDEAAAKGSGPIWIPMQSASQPGPSAGRRHPHFFQMAKFRRSLLC